MPSIHRIVILGLLCACGTFARTARADWTTIYGSALWPARSVICPCLHDEPYAYFDDVRAMLHSVRGLRFISAPEQALAEDRLGIRHPAAHQVGFGLDAFPASGARFRQRFGIDGPFLLYAGRLDPQKNVLQLVSHFLAHRRSCPQRDLKLVLAGSGPLALPDHPDLIPLGFLELQGHSVEGVPQHSNLITGKSRQTVVEIAFGKPFSTCHQFPNGPLHQKKHQDSQSQRHGDHGENNIENQSCSILSDDGIDVGQ